MHFQTVAPFKMERRHFKKEMAITDWFWFSKKTIRISAQFDHKNLVKLWFLYIHIKHNSNALYLISDSWLLVNQDWNYLYSTGKSLSEALILVSTNPQYDDRLFIELRVQYMKIASSEHVEAMLRTCCVQFFCFCFDIQNNLCTQHVLLMFWACSFHVLNW